MPWRLERRRSRHHESFNLCGTLVDVTSRSAHRGVRSLAFMTAAFVAGIAAGPARAAAPACFPERTVSAAITLRDDRRGVFGGLRAGQIVRLPAEPTAASGNWADIEIAEPIVISGRAERPYLVVFPRTDLEVQPGFSWVLAGAPLAILSGDQQTARVVVALPLHGDESLLPPVEVPCTLLSGTPPPDVTGWDSVGPLQEGRDQVLGRPVEWDGTRAIESDAGARSVPLVGHSFISDLRRAAPILVRLEGGRALVEVVSHRKWTRYRGWTARQGLRFRRKRAPDMFCGCLESGEWRRLASPPTPAAQLRKATPLRSTADGHTVTTLPGGASVIPQAVDGDESLVAWTDREERILLFGRVPTAALTPLSAADVNAVVAGRVRAPTTGTRLPDRLVVHARWGFGDVSFQTRTTVTPDGSFRFVSPVNRGKLEVSVEAPSELHLSATEYVELAAGKSTEVVLTLAPEESSPPDG